jgi:2-dehydropantoate 2-reductase
MKFTVLGAGALGSILSAQLIHAGHEVVVAARGRRAQQLESDGLNMSGLASADGLSCRVATDPSTLGATDVLIVTPKTYDHEAALAPYAALDVASVFSVANGIVKTEQMARVFGESRVLGCMADFSGELLASGEVIFTRNEGLWLGELAGGTSRRSEEIAAAIDGAGVQTQAVPDIESREWSKFVGWCALMVPSVLTRMATWKFMSDADIALIAVRVAREVASLAIHKGVQLQGQSPLPVAKLATLTEIEAVELVNARGRAMAAEAAEHRMSTLQDLERGKPLEVDDTIGYVLRVGREHGLGMPTLETVYPLIRGLSRVNAAPDNGRQAAR